MNGYFDCMYVFLNHGHTGAPPPETRESVLSTAMEVLRIKPGPLEEQTVFLTTELSLQPLILNFMEGL